jgi:hypothetical protein
MSTVLKIAKIFSIAGIGGAIGIGIAMSYVLLHGETLLPIVDTFVVWLFYSLIWGFVGILFIRE